MRDADHRRLRFTCPRPRVARQAFVAIDANLVALDGMWNERRLLGIIASLTFRCVLFWRQGRRRSFLIKRRRPSERREGLRQGEAGRQNHNSHYSEQSAV